MGWRDDGMAGLIDMCHRMIFLYTARILPPWLLHDTNPTGSHVTSDVFDAAARIKVGSQGAPGPLRCSLRADTRKPN